MGGCISRPRPAEYNCDCDIASFKLKCGHTSYVLLHKDAEAGCNKDICEKLRLAKTGKHDDLVNKQEMFVDDKDRPCDICAKKSANKRRQRKST
jgi:hypothetical protein